MYVLLIYFYNDAPIQKHWHSAAILLQKYYDNHDLFYDNYCKDSSISLKYAAYTKLYNIIFFLKQLKFINYDIWMEMSA